MRTDIHRPITFVPEDYEVVGYFDNAAGDPGSRSPREYHLYGRTVQAFSLKGAERIVLRMLVSESKSTAYHGGHQCDHCGAHIRYVAVFRHSLTGDHLAVGEECAEGRFTYSKAEFDRMRKEAQLDREKQRIVQARLAWLAEDPTRVGVIGGLMQFAEKSDFFTSLLHSFKTWGGLSQRQEAAARKSLEKWFERATTPKVELPTSPVVTGNAVQVTGNVLTTRWQEGRYGMTHKCLIADDRGFKVWGTVPSKGDWHVGDRVVFTAEVEQSKDDETFGFYKRPKAHKVLAVAS